MLVIDMSCSIRQDNVNGARCSFDGVYSLALDCVKPVLDKKTRTVTNLISVIIMRVQHEHVELVEFPADRPPAGWVLYSKLIEMREWTNHFPQSHGNYMPRLKMAKDTLFQNR